MEGLQVKTTGRCSGYFNSCMSLSALYLGIYSAKAPLALKQVKYGVYGDLILIYPKPYSIYLRGTIYYGKVMQDW